MLAAAILAASCDKISEEEYKGGRGTVIIDDSTDTDTLPAVRKVLLEDYTGQTCGNCPAANAIAGSIKDAHAGRVIVMEVHAGFFAQPRTSGTKYLTDFRCTAGNELDNFFGVSNVGNPYGMVNRLDFPTTEHVKSKEKWGGLVDSTLAKAPIAKIGMTSTYDEGTRAVTLKTSTKFVAEYPEPTSLVIYLTEDSLLGWQTDYSKPSGSQDVENYVHRHVLRAALNSTFGEALTTAPAEINKKVSNQFNYTLPANFVSKHCALIAVLYNSTTREVLQVEEVEIDH